MNKQLSLLSEDIHISKEDTFRPINYLGTKTRSLETILSLSAKNVSPGSQVVDLFTGTTIVAQGFAKMGYQVIAADALNMSTVFARALLGIQKSSDSSVERLKRKLVPSQPSIETRVFREWIELEKCAILQQDGDVLLNLLREIPQVWRPEAATEAQLSLFRDLKCHRSFPAFDIGGLISSYYGGTYFGIGQAVEADEIRRAIESEKNSGSIDEWEEAVLLTALLSALSDIVYSPGKHFAQYHSVRKDKDLSFQKRRLLQDRNNNVRALFWSKVETVFYYSCSTDLSHTAIHSEFEGFLEHKDLLRGCALIYADPPYTAQQYSRFYHIPEQVCSYKVPYLQRHRGSITKGLYPCNRHRSRFCSKRNAESAFRDLVTLADQVGAQLLISYAEVVSGESGNARMISLDSLIEVLSKDRSSSELEIYELDHNYRQFNQIDSARRDRQDRELLLLRT